MCLMPVATLMSAWKPQGQGLGFSSYHRGEETATSWKRRNQFFPCFLKNVESICKLISKWHLLIVFEPALFMQFSDRVLFKGSVWRFCSVMLLKMFIDLFAALSVFREFSWYLFFFFLMNLSGNDKTNYISSCVKCTGWTISKTRLKTVFFPAGLFWLQLLVIFLTIRAFPERTDCQGNNISCRTHLEVHLPTNIGIKTALHFSEPFVFMKLIICLIKPIWYQPELFSHEKSWRSLTSVTVLGRTCGCF